MTDEFRRRPTPQRQRFVEEFLLCDDAARAAIAARYKPTNAKVQGALLLKNPWVRAAIRAKLDARAEETRLSAKRILTELTRVGLSDIGNIMAWDEAAHEWTLRPPDELSAADRAAIARVTRHGNYLHVQLHDKIRALDALGKYFKLWGKHADKFGPRLGPGEAANGDYSNAQQARARARYIELAKQVLEKAERQEAEWAKAWREAFG